METAFRLSSMGPVESVKLYKELEKLIRFLVNRSKPYRPTRTQVNFGIRIIANDRYTLSAYRIEQKRSLNNETADRVLLRVKWKNPGSYVT